MAIQIGLQALDEVSEDQRDSPLRQISLSLTPASVRLEKGPNGTNFKCHERVGGFVCCDPSRSSRYPGFMKSKGYNHRNSSASELAFIFAMTRPRCFARGLPRAVKEVPIKSQEGVTKMKTVNGWIQPSDLGRYGTDYDTRAGIAYGYYLPELARPSYTNSLGAFWTIERAAILLGIIP